MNGRILERAWGEAGLFYLVDKAKLTRILLSRDHNAITFRHCYKFQADAQEICGFQVSDMDFKQCMDKVFQV